MATTDGSRRRSAPGSRSATTTARKAGLRIEQVPALLRSIRHKIGSLDFEVLIDERAKALRSIDQQMVLLHEFADLDRLLRTIDKLLRPLGEGRRSAKPSGL